MPLVIPYAQRFVTSGHPYTTSGPYTRNHSLHRPARLGLGLRTPSRAYILPHNIYKPVLYPRPHFPIMSKRRERSNTSPSDSPVPFQDDTTDEDDEDPLKAPADQTAEPTARDHPDALILQVLVAP
jgi:hypothetical protein